MPGKGQIALAGHTYTLAAETQLPSGSRVYTRDRRRTQPGDPGRLVTREWRLSGPIGQSRQSRAGALGLDWAQDLETRFTDLLTSAPAVTTVGLSTLDPSGEGSLLSFPLGGGNTLGGGVSASDVTHFDEDRSFLYCHRGRLSTKVDPSDWSVDATVVWDAKVRGASAWFGKGVIGLGPGAKAQRRTTVGSPDVYADVTLNFGSGSVSAYFNELRKGTDRLWAVRDDPAGSDANRLTFIVDDMVTGSNSLIVGDPGIPATGIGVWGPLMVAGSEVGAFSFTETGVSVQLLPAVEGHRHVSNGQQFAEMWGWLYVKTDLGLYAVIPGQTANPVGIGSQMMREFEGFDGKPSAIFKHRESLYVVYRTSGSVTHILRGEFNPQVTPGSGQPDFYPLRTRSAEVKAFTATSIPGRPTLVWGEGTNLGYASLGNSGGRDIDDTAYPFSVAGGIWYGSTLTESPHLKKTLRFGEFRTENCTASNSWALAVSVDRGSYVSVGAAVVANGYQRVFPVSAGAPLTTVTGYSLKPRLTQVAASSTTPPQLRGTLALTYDERPDHVLETDVLLVVEPNQLAALEALDDPTNGTPIEVVLPGETTVRYGFVTGIAARDLKGDAVTGAAVKVILWETAN